MFFESIKYREFFLNILFYNVGNFYKNFLFIKLKVCDNEFLVFFFFDIKIVNNSQNMSVFDNL